jgi:hypothetical protein
MRAWVWRARRMRCAFYDGEKVKGKTVTVHDNLSIIEVADKIQLDTLLLDAVASRYILTRLSDHVAAVEPGKFDALLARLRKLGHTPKVVLR